MDKKTLIPVIVLVTVFIASGCSMNTRGNNSMSGKTSLTESSVEKEQVELQVIGAGLNDEAYEKMKENNPNSTKVLITDMVKKNYPDIKVKFENWGWAEELDQKQRLAVMSGSPPDIVNGETFMPTYANMDILAPLPKDIVDMVNENFLLRNKHGEPVAVSPYGTVFLLFYNKDILKKAGFPENTPLKTWEDWKRVSDQITKTGEGKYYGGGIPTHPHAGGALRDICFIRMLGGDFGEGSKVTLNTPEMKEALEYIREMDGNFPAGIGNNPVEGAIYTMFNESKMGFVVNGTWQATECKAAHLNYGVTALPLPKDGKFANCLVGFDYYGVTKASKHPKEAFEIIRTILSKDAAYSIIKESNVPVANKEVLNDTKVMNQDSALAVATALIKSNKIKGLPVFEKNDVQVWDIIYTKVLAKVTMSKDPIDKIVAEAQDEIEKLLE